MPFLKHLTPEETEALFHKIKNTRRQDGDLLDEMTFQNVEQKLAKISEEENYLAKNRYRLQRTKLDFAEKKRMPIDE